MNAQYSFNPDKAGILGIDFRESNVRILQATAKTSLSKVLRSAEYHLPPELVKDGVFTKPRLIGALLNEHLVEDEILTRQCCFAIPNRYVTSLEIQMPKMSEAETREAAAFRLKKVLSFPVEDAYIETIRLDAEQADGNTPVIALATPKAVIDSRADALAYAGLEPIAAETDTHSIMRVIKRRAARLNSLERDSYLTVIEIGERTTAMYVIRQRRLQFRRTVKFGIQDLAGPIASMTSDPRLTVTKVLGLDSFSITPGGSLVFEDSEVTWTCPAHEELSRLVKEVARLLRYFKTMHPERSYHGVLDTMLVCGELAGATGFLDYFANEIACRTEALKPIQEVCVGIHTRVQDFLAKNEERYAIATGCLLLGINEMEREEDLTDGEQGHERIAI